MIAPGQETAQAVRALEMQLGVWWATVSANMIAERDNEIAGSGGVRDYRVGAQASGLSAPSGPAPGGSSGTGDCYGGPLPAYVYDRESRGNPMAENPSSHAWGCGQVMPAWYNGGACTGLDRYVVSDQHECERRILATQGPSAWGGF